MKKLVVSGWVSFIMLIPEDLFYNETGETCSVIHAKLMQVKEFAEAIVDTEIYHLEFDDMELLSGKEIMLSGDNGNIYLQLQQVDDFEVFF
jgi:hypothetical protein